MSNDLLMTMAARLIPLLAIGFVGVLMFYKIYIKIRSKFNAKVNCWFCNKNSKVPYAQINSWTCASCEQYNGFTKDGDYNREIYEQLDCSDLSGNKLNYTTNSSSASTASTKFSHNGFCGSCNEAQRIKVEKLAQFEPKNEAHFDEELKVYKEKLEKEFRLCDTCERHLNRVLRDKKKMVLGSKFLDFIMRGAETLKEPHFTHVRQLQNQKWKRRFTRAITLMAALNLCIAFMELPALRREQVIGVFGPSMGQPIFNVLSHGIALWRVLAVYAEKLFEHELYLKIALFSRTVFRMLLYSMGLKVAQIAEYTAARLFQNAAPFGILALAFGHHVVDGMKLTRFTALLLLWSAIAGGLIKAQPLPLFISSLVTFALVIAAKTDVCSKLFDSHSESFHKLYSEDYLSDEDTISMLSQQFDGSSVSMRSVSPNVSLRQRRLAPPCSPLSTTTTTTTRQFGKSPSLFGLNQLAGQNRAQLSPNASFCAEDNASRRSQYAASMCNFSLASAAHQLPQMPAQRASLFTSNLELQRPERPVFGQDPSASVLLNTSFAESTLGAHPAAAATPTPHVLGAAFPSTSSIPEFGQMYGTPFGAACQVPPPMTSGGGFARPNNVPNGMHSPFSVSTNTVYPERPASCVLAPSRFGGAAHASPSSATSWLSGGYFNQRQQPLQINNGLASVPLSSNNTGHFFEPRLEENLSRASSRSSGFESQTGRLNVSRENSMCHDNADNTILQRSVSMDLGKSGSAFQPISSECSEQFCDTAAFTRRPPLHFVQPCAESDAFGRLSFGLRGRGVDSFNLRKINEELPPIRRGDLLRKWKDGQPTVA